MNMLTLKVDPADALVDIPRRILLSGAESGAEVRIETETSRSGFLWKSSACYRADEVGEVDLTRDAPHSGDYSGVSAMGLIWSQTCAEGGAKDHAQFNADMAQPLETLIKAHSGDHHVEAQMIQRLMGPGVRRQAVNENGLVGVLYRPADDNPAPAVMLLNGSNGGINEARAALWASRGYNAFTLGYFGMPGVQRYISNTDLEYFSKAVDWLRKAVSPLDGFVAVSGQSRGGELALLLGSTFPDQLSAVVGYVPSAFVHGGQAACDPELGRDGPSWRLNGKALPHIWDDNGHASWEPYDNGEPPRRNSKAMMTALGDPDALERARIPVERIKGPVLLISGGDDGAWPSDLYSMVVSSSLRAAGHPHEVAWENYPVAGHSILFPYVPTTRISHAHPVNGILTTMGGTPEANAQANEASWRAIQNWMRRATGIRDDID